jgi:uncharacterized lipoprotein
MRKLKLMILSALILFVAGCSYLPQGNRASSPSYDNKTIPRLRVPSGMDISMNTLYPIPQRNYPSNPRPVDITPPSLDVSPNAGSGWFSW